MPLCGPPGRNPAASQTRKAIQTMLIATPAQSPSLMSAMRIIAPRISKYASSSLTAQRRTVVMRPTYAKERHGTRLSVSRQTPNTTGDSDSSC
jgi:hypothetical protein